MPQPAPPGPPAKFRPKGRVKTMRLTETGVTLLRQLARERGVSESDVIEELLRAAAQSSPVAA